MSEIMQIVFSPFNFEVCGEACFITLVPVYVHLPPPPLLLAQRAALPHACPVPPDIRAARPRPAREAEGGDGASAHGVQEAALEVVAPPL